MRFWVVILLLASSSAAAQDCKQHVESKLNDFKRQIETSEQDSRSFSYTLTADGEGHLLSVQLNKGVDKYEKDFPFDADHCYEMPDVVRLWLIRQNIALYETRELQIQEKKDVEPVVEGECTADVECECLDGTTITPSGPDCECSCGMRQRQEFVTIGGYQGLETGQTSVGIGGGVRWFVDAVDGEPEHLYISPLVELRFGLPNELGPTDTTALHTLLGGELGLVFGNVRSFSIGGSAGVKLGYGSHRAVDLEIARADNYFHVEANAALQMSFMGTYGLKLGVVRPFQVTNYRINGVIYKGDTILPYVQLGYLF